MNIINKVSKQRAPCLLLQVKKAKSSKYGITKGLPKTTKYGLRNIVKSRRELLIISMYFTYVLYSFHCMK